MDIEGFIVFSKTPLGIFLFRIFLVFLIAEFMGRIIPYKILIFFHFDKKIEKTITDLSGYFVNICAGIGMAYLYRNGTHDFIIDGLWYIFGSMGFHYIHIRYVDKFFKNKVAKR